MELRDLLQNRQRCYQQTFMDEGGKVVLRDLLRFCRVDKSCYNDNERRQAYLEGRRDVGMRIMKHLNMDFEDFYQDFLASKRGE